PAFAEFKKWKGKNVLEIGCGIGTDTINFARAGAHVTAVDLSKESIKLAKQRAKVFKVYDKIKFYVADAENLSKVVPPKSYDLVYSFGVIHHSPKPKNIIKQIKDNYSKPGTILKLMVYNRYSWKVFWILMKYGYGAFWKLEELIARYSEAQTGCPVTYSYRRKDIPNLLGKGFRIEDMTIDHIFPYRIKDYVKHKYVKEWYFRYLPKHSFRWLENIMGWHLCVTAKRK
ncbi:class I SAM-dependent methyltransferase, partial [Nanoarchaeota archaeon]